WRIASSTARIHNLGDTVVIGDKIKSVFAILSDVVPESKRVCTTHSQIGNHCPVGYRLPFLVMRFITVLISIDPGNRTYTGVRGAGATDAAILSLIKIRGLVGIRKRRQRGTAGSLPGRRQRKRYAEVLLLHDITVVRESATRVGLRRC